MQGRTLAYIFLAKCLLLPLIAAGAEDAEWRLISDRKGIQVYRGTDDASRLKAFRGVTTMELRDEYAMLSLYNDIDAFPSWLHMIDTAELVHERDPLDRDLRFTINLPWPITDREVLVNAKLVHITREDEESVTAWLTGDPDLLPESDGFVRLPEMRGVFRFQRREPGLLKVTYQVSMDMGGYLPDWIVNLVLRDLPYFTLEKLRRMVHREEYQGRYYDYLDLMGPGRPADLPPPRSWVYGTSLPTASASAEPAQQAVD